MSKIYCKTKTKDGEKHLRSFQFGDTQENLSFIKDQRLARNEVELYLKEECILPILVVV
jgi:hypothetical protein